MPLQIVSWHVGVLGCGWKEQRATIVFVCYGLERNFLLSGVRRLNQKILESPQRSISFPPGFRWTLVTEKGCLRWKSHPPSWLLSFEVWSLPRASATPQATSCSLSSGHPMATHKFSALPNTHLHSPLPIIPSKKGHPVATVTSHNPGLPPRAGGSCLVRKVYFLVSCFLLSRSLCPLSPSPLMAACPHHSSFLTRYGHLASVRGKLRGNESSGCGSRSDFHPRDTEAEI